MAVLASLPAPVRGALWMIVAGLGYTTMSILVRRLSGEFSTYQLLFLRNVVALLLMAPWMFQGGLSALRTRQLPLHCLRTALAYVATLGLFYGVTVIPLAEATALSFTQPLFIVVLAAFLLRERIGNARAIATLIGFLGVLVVLRPGIAEIGIGALVIVGAAAIYAGSNICIKILVRTDTPSVTVVYVNLLMIPLSAGPAAASWVTPDWSELAWIIALGAAGTLGVIGLTRAYRVADASAVVPFDFLKLPFAAFGAYLLFGESADLWTWLGATIIFASSYALVRSERRATPASAPAARP